MNIMKSDRGSAMIVALIFGAIIAIALSSYIRLAMNAGRLSNRSFYSNAARNLADTGLEHALWSLNNLIPATSPDSWTKAGFVSVTGGQVAIFPTKDTSYALSGGATGQVRVWIQDPATAITDNRRCLARATVTLPNEAPITTTVECYIEPRSFFGGGMITRNGIDFNGNVDIDSWESFGHDADPTNDKIYDGDSKKGAPGTNNKANARIASPTLVSIETANVYGKVAIGTDDKSGLSYQKTTGVVSDKLGTKSGVDWSLVEHNFSSSFPDVKGYPTSGSPFPAAVGGVITLTTGTYWMSNFTLGDVINIPTGVIATVVVDGNFIMDPGGQVVINSGAKLSMFVGGTLDMKASGGILSGTAAAPNPPPSFTLKGTRTAADAASVGMQLWKVQGNDHLSAAIFAPNANIEVWGTGDIYGSIVGNYVDMRGTGNFHQDESLAKIKDSGLWGLTKWREITTATEMASTSIATPLSFTIP